MRLLRLVAFLAAPSTDLHAFTPFPLSLSLSLSVPLSLLLSLQLTLSHSLFLLVALELHFRTGLVCPANCATLYCLLRLPNTARSLSVSAWHSPTWHCSPPAPALAAADPTLLQLQFAALRRSLYLPPSFSLFLSVCASVRMTAKC